MADMMERQESLNLTLPRSVAVVGCGGVGSWTAYFLALAGVKELWLFDMDTISEHNLNRIPLPIASVGKKKTEAIAELIGTVRPQCTVLAMGGFSEDIAKSLNLDTICTWIVATTDSLGSRQMVHKWAEKVGMSYIEAAAEGEFGSCTGEPAEWATPQEAEPGYQSVPVWVGPCVFSAGIAVAHIIHATSIGDRAIRMGWENDLDTGVEEFVMFDSRLSTEGDEENGLETETETDEEEVA